METIFTAYSQDFIFEEVQKRSFEIYDISNAWSNLIDNHIIDKTNIENKYILNRNFLDYDVSNKKCEEKIIEIMKRDISDVYYSIMLECQKTKTFQMINQIFKILGINLFSNEIILPTSNKKAFFLVSQNMQDLTSQNCERIFNDLGDYIQIFIFTSQNERNQKNMVYNPKIEDVVTYILHYLNNESEEYVKIPMAIFLANPNQIKKMNTLLEIIDIKNNQYIQNKDIENKDIENKDIVDTTKNSIQSYIFFDEADQTYPLAREILMKSIFDLNVYETFKVIRPLNSINKVYWISATQEEMVLAYPECTISKQALIQFQSGVMENHYSILDESAIIHSNIQSKDMENNDYLLQVVENNRCHFFDKMSNNSYRKIIGMTNVDNNKQKILANTLNSMGANVILLNQDGLFLYFNDICTIKYIMNDMLNVLEEKKNVNYTYDKSNFIKVEDFEIKSRNALIAKIYNETYVELQNAPLFILGNRKVDRGLTFHYAPVSEDKKSFILTDLIMGRIPNWKRAVQAIGRGNGVIKHHRDFIGTIDYWVDPITIENVKRHCKMMSDPLLISSDPSFSVSEIVQMLNEKYPDISEESVNKRGPRNKYIYNFTESYHSFNELCEDLSKKYVVDDSLQLDGGQRPTKRVEKFRKTFVMINGYYISTRLKKHFHVSKKEELNESHIITKEILESIVWSKVLYGSDMKYVIIPYYENINSKVQWIAIMKENITQ